jgi:hypothetical protein
MLDHYWLKMIPNYNTKMGKAEMKEYLEINKIKARDESSSSSSCSESEKEESSGFETESADDEEVNTS